MELIQLVGEAITDILTTKEVLKIAYSFFFKSQDIEVSRLVLSNRLVEQQIKSLSLSERTIYICAVWKSLGHHYSK